MLPVSSFFECGEKAACLCYTESYHPEYARRIRICPRKHRAADSREDIRTERKQSWNRNYR